MSPLPRGEGRRGRGTLTPAPYREKMGLKMQRVALIVFIVVLFCPSVIAGTQRFNVPIEGSPSLGPDNAPVVMVEFLDYQ